MKTTNAKKGKHLTNTNRIQIEAMLNEEYSIRYIANRIDCAPSTISREIRNHAIEKKSRSNDCMNSSKCTKRHACGNTACNRKCKACNRCKKKCPDYTKRYCDYLEERGLCNGCRRLPYCNLDQRIYDGNIAHMEYRDNLIESRSGFDLTGEQIEQINAQVSPRIKSGQSPYHIKQSYGDELIVSESTLRRMILKSELDVRQIDLKEAVRRKPRKKHYSFEPGLISPQKIGRMYTDFLEFRMNAEMNYVEMDCVEGVKSDTAAILSLHFVMFHMQLYYPMEEHTSKCVVDTLDLIESAIGYELFATLFPVILTDNGHEFWDIHGMERGYTQNKERTKIFFCDPNRSDQKGACENNHKLFRCIVPKGTSISKIDLQKTILITNHINSYRRKSLFGHSPYELAMNALPEDFFALLGLEIIPSEEINLTPFLIS